MTIQETAAAIHKLRKEISITAKYARRVRQAEKLRNLEEQYGMMLLIADLAKQMEME